MSKKRPPINDKNSNQGLIGLGPIPNQAPVASFNIHGIESLIQTKGFIAYHYRHALNPVRASQNGPADPNTQVSFRGLRYYNPRPLYHVPRSYTMDDLLTAQAVYEKGSVLFNISGTYADTKQDQSNIAHVRGRDLLIFPSMTDMTQQLLEYNPTGPQKLQYKCKSVDIMYDDERDYVCDQDFKVNDEGCIVWLKGGQRPDFKNGKGAVLSITYFFTPIYIVSHQIHHLRIIPSNEVGHGGLPREAVYAPQQFVCVPSTIVEESDVLAWTDLPPLPEYPASKNTTGGSV